MSHDHDAATATAAPSAARGRPWVLASWPGGNAHRELPEEGSIVIGRGTDCDLVVPHGSVSRRHARVTRRQGAMTVEDLGSANGTKLRGRRLPAHAPTAIEEDVAIELGDVALLVRAPAAGPENERGPEPRPSARSTPQPVTPPARPAPAPLADALAKVERERIVEVLALCGGNQTRAAALLGISRRTLVSRMNEYGLPRPLKGWR